MNDADRQHAADLRGLSSGLAHRLSRLTGDEPANPRAEDARALVEAAQLTAAAPLSSWREGITLAPGARLLRAVVAADALLSAAGRTGLVVTSRNVLPGREALPDQRAEACRLRADARMSAVLAKSELARLGRVETTGLPFGPSAQRPTVRPAARSASAGPRSYRPLTVPARSFAAACPLAVARPLP